MQVCWLYHHISKFWLKSLIPQLAMTIFASVQNILRATVTHMKRMKCHNWRARVSVNLVLAGRTESLRIYRSIRCDALVERDNHVDSHNNGQAGKLCEKNKIMNKEMSWMTGLSPLKYDTLHYTWYRVSAKSTQDHYRISLCSFGGCSVLNHCAISNEYLRNSER